MFLAAYAKHVRLHLLATETNKKLLIKQTLLCCMLLLSYYLSWLLLQFVNIHVV